MASPPLFASVPFYFRFRVSTSNRLQHLAQPAEEWSVMRRFHLWIAVLLVTNVFGAFGAGPELTLPSLTIKGEVYSNVVVSPSSGGRVMTRHAAGIGTVKIAELELEVCQQLVAARVITGPAARQILQEVAAKKKAQARQAGGSTTATGALVLDGEAGAFIQSLRARLENEIRALGFGHFDIEKSFSSLNPRILTGIAGGIIGLYLLRCWFLFRICQRATGRGSILVFVPLVRWFPLAEAAKISRNWLAVPLFGFAGFYLPPNFPGLPWLPLAYVTTVAVLWLTTLILFAVWCVRICKALRCSPFLSVLLFLPVLEWLALPYLAFNGHVTQEKFSLKSRALAI